MCERPPAAQCRLAALSRDGAVSVSILNCVLPHRGAPDPISSNAPRIVTTNPASEAMVWRRRRGDAGSTATEARKPHDTLSSLRSDFGVVG